MAFLLQVSHTHKDGKCPTPIGILNRTFAVEIIESQNGGKLKDETLKDSQDDTDALVGEYASGEEWRIMRNVFLVSICYMFIFTGMAGTEGLQSSMNASDGLGTIAMAGVYIGVVTANIFFSTLVIRWLGCKWTMVIAMVGMMPFVAAQYHASFYSLVPLGILNGFATGINWVAASTYITVISEAYSKMTNTPKQVVVPKFFAIFFMFYQSAQIFGSLISWLVFKHHDGNAGQRDPSLCGVNFCPASSNHTLQPQISDEAVVMIVATYIFIMLLTVPILSLLLDSLQRYGEGVRESSSSGVTGFRLLYVTVKVLLKEQSVKLVIPISFFLGLEKCFIMSSFTHAFITCSVGIKNVGFVMTAFGFTNAFTTPITSWIAKHTGRVPVVMTASLLHASIIIMLMFWTPHSSQEYILTTIAALWGIAEGIWMVQINALYGLVFHGNEEAAFSNYRLFRAGGYTLGYLTSSFICTNFQLYTLLIFLFLGSACYIIVEFKERTKQLQIVQLSEH